MKPHLLDLSENQLLEVVLEGEPQRKALVLHHGAFGSCENMAPIFREATQRGYFVIGITRPGYAGSTRRKGRRAKDYVLETKAALDHFKVEKFVSLGWSSGSPAAISDLQDIRCNGAITIAGDAPRDSNDWESYLEKYLPSNPPTESADFPGFDVFRSCTAGELVPVFGSSLSTKDVEICNSGMGEELAIAMRKGMASGDFGALDDMESDASPWGIALSEVTKPVFIFQGGEDRMCTPAHGHFLADNIPGAQLIIEQGEGHISLMYNKAAEIVDRAIKILNS
jgi:pimeloyl-ACP methyl ester carboxylesterase